MTPLEKLAAIVKARTEAPWTSGASESYLIWATKTDERGKSVGGRDIGSCNSPADTRFVVAVGTLADLMLDVIRASTRLDEVVAYCEEEDEPVSGYIRESNGQARRALAALNAAIERMESK